MYMAGSSDPAFTLPIGRLTAMGGHPVSAGAGLGNLGATEPAGPDCPEPTSTADRDAIRDKLNSFTRNWMGQKPKGIHWHERHPDIKAAIEDIIIRMIGITQRPQKLRCSAEMRKRAREWNGSLHSLLVKVKTGGAGYGGATVVPQTFTWSFYRGPTYTIRSTNDPVIKAAMGGSGTLPAPVSSAPPGSVVVGGQAFSSSAAARAASATTATAPMAADVIPKPPGGAPSILEGIPTNYLLYGGLGLAAFMFLRK